MKMKTCRTCKVSRPKLMFWGQKSSRDKLQGECKICCRVRNNAWQRAHRKKRSAQKIAGVLSWRQKYPMRAWLRGAKNRATKNGLDFSLVERDIYIPEKCPVLGIPLISLMGSGECRGMRDDSPSIDRIDNSRGYELDNIAIVSMRVNRIKSNATIEELRLIADWYHERRLGKETAGERFRNSSVEIRTEPDFVSGMLSFAS